MVHLPCHLRAEGHLHAALADAAEAATAVAAGIGPRARGQRRRWLRFGAGRLLPGPRPPQLALPCGTLEGVLFFLLQLRGVGSAELGAHFLQQRKVQPLHQVRVLDVATEILALCDGDAVLLLREVLTVAELRKGWTVGKVVRGRLSLLCIVKALGAVLAPLLRLLCASRGRPICIPRGLC